MRRRTFLQLIGLPALGFVRPRAVVTHAASGPVYTDDLHTANLSMLNNRAIVGGIEYGA